MARLWCGRSTSETTFRQDRTRSSSAATRQPGCRSAVFLVRADDSLVLIDAGLGPDMQQLPHGMHLVGAQLPAGLRALGVSAADITDVICSHFQADHVGWLFGA
jgi:glyoxylase-like metal-dependent hydrolase (beta-lactamase superfamily II)